MSFDKPSPSAQWHSSLSPSNFDPNQPSIGNNPSLLEGQSTTTNLSTRSQPRHLPSLETKHIRSTAGRTSETTSQSNWQNSAISPTAKGYVVSRSQSRGSVTHSGSFAPAGLRVLRNSLSTPSPTNSRAVDSSPPYSASSVSQGQSLASPTTSSTQKISIAQLSILLDTNPDKPGKSQKIQRLLESNGQEVWTVFARKAILLNASTISTGTSSSVPSIYRLLNEQIALVCQDPLVAFQIVDSVNAGKEDYFRSHDIVNFNRHFLTDFQLSI